MALLPSGIVVGTTGNDTSPTEKRDGGTAVGITSGTDTSVGPITQTFPLTSNAVELDTRRVTVIQATGTSAYNAQTAKGSGAFAYDQDQFMIRTVATKINNVSSNVLLINGHFGHNRPHTLVSNKSKGAKTSTAHRSGYWRGVGIAGQRTNWSSSVGSNNVDYVLPTNNASNAVDQALFATYKSIPGELAFMFGAIDAKQADYEARKG